MGDRPLDDDGGTRARAARRGGDGCGCTVVGVLLLALPVVALALRLNGNLLGWGTERDLAAFYGAVARGDYAAAARVIPAAEAADVRLWARDEGEGHGPPVAIRTVAYDFRLEFGEYGDLFYTVRYRDGAEEHNAIFNRPHHAFSPERRAAPRGRAGAVVASARATMRRGHWPRPHTLEGSGTGYRAQCPDGPASGHPRECRVERRRGRWRWSGAGACAEWRAMVR